MEKLAVLVLGHGKLAEELLEGLNGLRISRVVRWEERKCLQDDPSIVVHAGSGREIDDVMELGVPESEIKSERDPKVQKEVLGIPSPFLDRHAFHQIVIRSPDVEIRLETRVLGKSAYAPGLLKIIDVVAIIGRISFSPKSWQNPVNDGLIRSNRIFFWNRFCGNRSRSERLWTISWFTPFGYCV